MSFGSGGFGGFGSNNNNTQSTFGGFGSNNNNSSGFGSNTNTGGSIFGGANNNTGGGLFGSNNNASTTSPFGGGGGFGSNNNNTPAPATTSFGSKPFGSSTTGGGLFGGGSTSNTTFGGGFGSTNSTPSAFGGGNTNGGIFGQNKSTGFGSTTTTTGTGGLFGGGSTSGGFGANNTTGGFGASTSGGFGATSNANNGTAGPPFQPFTEKDPGAANGSAQYQTITFQQPYSNYSLEELRVVDYAQGRRYGNQNGQAGAFGQSTGFGGFGSNNNTTTNASFGATNTNTGGGLFGSQNNATSTPFGSNTNSTFGNNNNNSTSGGGIFGQNKPAGGVFGANTTTQSGTTGGLFGGTTNTTSNPFGSTNTNNAFGASTGNTGGGLFGQNNATQNKPAFGGFGTNTSATNSNPFGGSTTNTGGGLFGQQNQATSTPAFGAGAQTSTNAGGGLFGGNNNNNTATNTSGLFGQNQQTQNQSTGGLFGGGLGQNQQNQQKPGIFGGSTTTTGGGLFGGAQQNQAQSGGAFGQNKPGGGLFGGASSQPSGGLFGNPTTNTSNTSGGLFGGLGSQNNNQQNSGNSLFGGANNQQKLGGQFGGSTNTNTNSGGGLFSGLNQSNNNSAPLGGSLLGGNQSQQQSNQQPMNNSLFGASANSLLNTSMTTNPYGNDPLFAGLSTPLQSPGPLATPLSSSQKNKRSAILPQHKLNPSQSTRLLTPQGKRNGGYGFTYSTYGTPSSTQSSPLGGSMFSTGNLSRHLGKSLSSSNLRNTYTAETSVLAPGAFSMTGRPYGTGSLKKLNLNRNLNQRPALFEDSTPKRVSFVAASPEIVPNGSANNGESSSPSNALVVRDEVESVSPPATVNGTSSTSRKGKSPEMEQVNGVDLAPVPENRTLQPRTSASLNIQNGQTIDPTPGGYWSEPSIDALKKMSHSDLKSVSNFVVGRDKVGKIEFHYGKPVDLSGTPLDKLFGDIISLNHRNATVYGDTCTVAKPPLGSGLNQPSRITMGNSWPRGTNRAGKQPTKHIERLKRVNGTSFEKYDNETGEWVFGVPHFSSYGFQYDQPEDLESSELSPVPETPARFGSSQMTSTPQDSVPSATQSSPDDTFDFKRGLSKRTNVPGQFDDDAVYEEEDDEEMEETSESFLGGRSVGSPDGQHEYLEGSESESVEDQDMADSVSGPIRTTEQDIARQADPFKDSVKPKSILKASHLFRPTSDTPSKGPTVFDDDWANALQRTISPRKQDRRALRECQGDALRERGNNTASLAQSLGVRNTKATMSRMELMDSLFGKTSAQKSSSLKRVERGIQYPYAKRPKTANDLDQLTDADKEFHSCGKPHFSETGLLVYTGKGTGAMSEDSYDCSRAPIAGAQKDVRFKQLPTFADAAPPTIVVQQEHTRISYSDEVPQAKLRTEPSPLEFSEVADAVPLGTAAGVQEHKAWQLLSLLFDGGSQIPPSVPQDEQKQWLARDRKERLSRFWQSLVFEDAHNHAKEAATHEEKALAYLSCHSIADAVTTLFHASDLRLATIVSQLGGDAAVRQDMSAQVTEWRKMDELAEMDEPVRALYELIQGNCAEAEGKTGVGRENKVSTFKIASRFNLDWRRAFGIRLWYQAMADEPIEMAVAQFMDALRDGNEDVKPVPWFIEQGIDMGWTDPLATQREDILWGILKLYASSKMDVSTNLEDVLAPENVSGHPLNSRFSFQLFQMFYSRRIDPSEEDDRIVGMPTFRDSISGGSSDLLSSVNSTNGIEQANDPLVELGDKLTLTYAASLHTPKHWTTAAWVYTHLSNPAMRSHGIRSLLNQFSNTYEIGQSDPTYQALLKLSIPQQWMHAASALQAKCHGDSLHQAAHLIKANELQEAHEVLCRSVGPDAIISRHLDPLRELLGGFEDVQTAETITGWVQGGQIYFDYIHLLDLTEQRNPYRPDDKLNHDIHGLLRKLQRSLEKVATDRWDGVSLEERVALSEIAGTVANLMAKNKLTDRASVLRLPLTEDLWLRHSVDLSTSYYRNMVA
ncbi:hypothetical protein P171DRAFT_427737 [Karstenula rhodostoma CBS 690.94]|uniref:Peptidase S59 domain-containing protein n=1 Tax=Karstenula rhodostoma CBS 690.94 TaxID=1392251 RepID=A0A9P4UGV3_9PLEO|nr:hypothetical protein P171DRAFT_427737 [Karstenula rhodostoma CBS 690.94]